MIYIHIKKSAFSEADFLFEVCLYLRPYSIKRVPAGMFAPDCKKTFTELMRLSSLAVQKPLALLVVVEDDNAIR